MQQLIFVFLLAVLLAAVFGVIAFVKRIRKKAYKIPWTICRFCFAGGMVSLMVAASNGQWKLMLFFVAMLLVAYGVCQAGILGIRKLAKNSSTSATTFSTGSQPGNQLFSNATKKALTNIWQTANR